MDIETLRQLEKKVLWLASWMIHNANNIRENTDGLKVGGHQASTASSSTILSALLFQCMRPTDRLAVKPHASPAFHAAQYLLGKQTLDKLKNFRGYGGAQSYPSRTKDTADVDFSTGSVGLGVAQTLFASLVQDYLLDRGLLEPDRRGKMIALLGDAEMDEGNIFEALLEGWKYNLANTWWIIDYNRQSLDGFVGDGMWRRFQSLFEDFGWDVVVLKYGKLLQQAFHEPGGAALEQWIDSCPNQLYSALTYQGGSVWRERLTGDLASNGEVMALINKRTDEQLHQLMTNLGGHDLECITSSFEAARQHDRPVCFLAYTIKGNGLPLAGHKDNHSGLLTTAQIETWRDELGIRAGHEWEKLEALSISENEWPRILTEIPMASRASRRMEAATISVPATLAIPQARLQSTQQGFGSILNEIARSDHAVRERIITAAPDVTVSTNLGAWINKRKIYHRTHHKDTFKSANIPSAYNWEKSPQGQHIELGIAENNLFTVLSALGLAHSLFGERLLPIGTLYDPFIYRGADALNYACYQDARFMLVATPSGVSLAPEGGAHQSIGTPLIGMAQDGLAYFEPAFVDELSVIMRWSFEHMQRSGEHATDLEDLYHDATGGSVYLRLSTRPIEQLNRAMSAELERDVLNGAYWLRKPGPNADAIVAYAGAVAPEAIDAVGRLGELRRDIGLLAVTSPDRLKASWKRAQEARAGGHRTAVAHIEQLLAQVPRHAGLVTVMDADPLALGWLGSVCGHRTQTLGVSSFGQTGTIADLYRHFGIDSSSIIAAVQELVPGSTRRFG
jgi:pyruvate dehydrogenase E1 component